MTPVRAIHVLMPAIAERIGAKGGRGYSSASHTMSRMRAVIESANPA